LVEEILLGKLFFWATGILGAKFGTMRRLSVLELTLALFRRQIRNQLLSLSSI